MTREEKMDRVDAVIRSLSRRNFREEAARREAVMQDRVDQEGCSAVFADLKCVIWNGVMP